MPDDEKSSREKREIRRAAHDLALPEAQFRIVPEALAAPILTQIEAQFVERTGLRWWWEALKDGPMAHVHFKDGNGWSYLTRIVPPESELVWFVVESDPDFVLCEGRVEAVQSVIGECWGFEYYVVSQNLDWLVSENHSDVVSAVGEAVVDRLAQIAGT